MRFRRRVRVRYACSGDEDCGVVFSGPVDILIEHFASKEFGLPKLTKGRWEKRELTWEVYPDSVPEKFGVKRVEKITEKILGKISKKCGLSFRKNTSEAFAQLRIKFDFSDGKNGRLGLAHFPNSPEKGLIFIDPEENWGRPGFLGFFAEYDLYTVIFHEILHALGIPHVRDRFSVMYDHYNGRNRRFDRLILKFLITLYGHQVKKNRKI